jgi:hypothetical protein
LATAPFAGFLFATVLDLDTSGGMSVIAAVITLSNPKPIVDRQIR